MNILNWLMKNFASRNFLLNILVKPLLYCNKGEFVAAPCVLVWNWFSAHGEKKDFGSEKNSALIVCSS